LTRLELRYQVTIGDFSSRNQTLYTVRVGPYDSLEKAQRAKAELDQELKVDSVIVKIR